MRSWSRCKLGDLLFHGDAATEKQLGVKLSATGMACAMCHPYASDTHPHEFPKFQEQMEEFATLRDMINWCIEKPNEGEKIDHRQRGDEGARGLHLLVEPKLEARPGQALKPVRAGARDTRHSPPRGEEERWRKRPAAVNRQRSQILTR